MTTPGAGRTAATDHAGMEVLTADDCYRLLGDHVVGRIAFVDAGTPVVLPVNYVLDGRSIVFRTATGSKLHTALMRRPVAFQVDEIDEEHGNGWSVLVRGTADLVDPDDVAALAARMPHAWVRTVPRTHWVTILPDTVTGRRIPEA